MRKEIVEGKTVEWIVDEEGFCRYSISSPESKIPFIGLFRNLEVLKLPSSSTETEIAASLLRVATVHMRALEVRLG